MLKMLLDAIGGTNPADGSTSVIVRELVLNVELHIKNGVDPTVFYKVFDQVAEHVDVVLDSISELVDVNNSACMLKLVQSRMGSTIPYPFGDKIAGLAIDAISTIAVGLGQGLRNADLKKYIKVEWVHRGRVQDSKVLSGVRIHNDVDSPGTMRGQIVNPCIILFSCPIEFTKEEGSVLEMEDAYIWRICSQIVKLKPDLVITEKTLSNLACQYLINGRVSVISKVRKADNHMVAKACGAVIVNRLDELQESDVGCGAGLFDVQDNKTFIVQCKDPKACTVILSGFQTFTNVFERVFEDALSAARDVIANPKVLPGGGIVELIVSAKLKKESSFIEGIEKIQETDEARRKFPNAKSISSAQFFGHQEKMNDTEGKSRLQKFRTSNAITSADLFGREVNIPPPDLSTSSANSNADFFEGDENWGNDFLAQFQNQADEDFQLLGETVQLYKNKFTSYVSSLVGNVCNTLTV